MNLLKRDVMVLNKEISHAFTVILLGSTQITPKNKSLIISIPQKRKLTQFKLIIVFKHEKSF